VGSGFQEVLVSEAGNCKTIVGHSWIVIAPGSGRTSMKASQEPLEETKVGGGDLVVYPTLPGKPVQSQDTLRRKLLKACAGSNPTWIGAPSCLILLSDPLPSRNWPDSALQGKHLRATRIQDGALPSLAVPQVCRRQLFGTPPCRRWFYTESQSGSCSNAVGMTLILPASDSTRFVRLSQVAQVRKSEVRCIRRS